MKRFLLATMVFAVLLVSGARADVSQPPNVVINQTFAAETALSISGSGLVTITRADGTTLTAQLPAAQAGTAYTAVGPVCLSGTAISLCAPAGVTPGSTLGKAAFTNAYGDLTGLPSLAPVATSGAYGDLTGKPSIPAAYTLPVATSAAPGGVKQGPGNAIAPDGTLTTLQLGTAVGTAPDAAVTNAALAARAPLANPVFAGSITLPSWSTAGRPASPVVGMEGYNTDYTPPRRESWNGGPNWVWYERRYDVLPLTWSAAPVLDGSLTRDWTITMTGATAFPCITNIVAGASYTIKLTEDGTGGRVPSFATSGCYDWVGRTAPTFGTAAGASYIVTIKTYDTTTLYAVASGPF